MSSICISEIKSTLTPKNLDACIAKIKSLEDKKRSLFKSTPKYDPEVFQQLKDISDQINTLWAEAHVCEKFPELHPPKEVKHLEKDIEYIIDEETEDQFKEISATASKFINNSMKKAGFYQAEITIKGGCIRYIGEQKEQEELETFKVTIIHPWDCAIRLQNELKQSFQEEIVEAPYIFISFCAYELIVDLK